jgi:hypothetical protein
VLRVRYDPKRTSPEALQAVIADEGFEAAVVPDGRRRPDTGR